MSPLIHRSILVAVLAASAPLLAGCEGSQLERDFGLARTSPDEFTVTTRAPLSMPTSADLVKPTPGTNRPQDQDTQMQALETLAPDVALRGTGGTGSAGQDALVSDAARASTQAPTGGALDHPGRGFVDELMFWNGGKAGDIVDVKGEKQRLQEDAALGRSPTTGATPTVKDSKPGFFQRLF